MVDPVQLDGRGLRPSDVAAVAREERTALVAPEAFERVRHAHRVALEVAARRPVYGRSTGVGANRSVTVTDPRLHGTRLLRSHASGAGPLLPAEQVRATMVVRLNQLLAGGSGVSAEVVAALAGAVEAGALPSLRSCGAVGTGDLSALAELALTLAGERPWTGPDQPAVAFDTMDALPFISSSAVTLATASLALDRLHRFGDAAVTVAALSFLAARANAEALSPAAAVATPLVGATRTAGRLRLLLGTLPEPARIQDPYGFRTLPQTHGALVDGLDGAESLLLALLNAPSENPLVDVQAGDVVHHGGFQLHSLTAALDSLRLGTARAASLARARTGHLLDPRITALTPFLADGAAGSSGLMGLEYTAASAVARLRHLATPVSTQTAVLSLGMEEDASFANLAADLTLDAAEPLGVVLAAELVTAVRALRMQQLRPAGPLGGVWDQLLDRLPADLGDRSLSEDLDTAGALLPSLTDLVRGLEPR